MTANITPDGKFAYYSEKGIHIIDLGDFIPTVFSAKHKKVYYIRDSDDGQTDHHQDMYCTKYPFTEHKLHVLDLDITKQYYINRGKPCTNHHKKYHVHWFNNGYKCVIHAPENSILLNILYLHNQFDYRKYIIMIYLLDDVLYRRRIRLIQNKTRYIRHHDDPYNTYRITYESDVIHDDGCVHYIINGEDDKYIVYHLLTGRSIQLIIYDTSLFQKPYFTFYANHVTMEVKNETFIFSYNKIDTSEQYIKLSDYPDFDLEPLEKPIKSARNV